MRVTSIVAAAVVVFAAAAMLVAQEGAPKPPPELSQLAYFEGTWICRGKTFETPIGPATTTASTVVARKDLDGHFVTATKNLTSPGMPPFEGRFSLTYDPGGKQFVVLWTDSMGGWALFTSSGWKGDAIVLEGDSHMGAEALKARDTFTKKSGTSYTHTWAVEVGGKWTTAAEETCTTKG